MNLIKKCKNSRKKEFYYGALMNKNIKDVYLGYGYLEPHENRGFGPGEGHEEIVMVLNGKIKLKYPENEIILKDGDVYFLEEGLKIEIENLTDEQVSYVIAGGHPTPHGH
ncbi:MAG: cupin domain-containing protein [Candidatus Hodarchaeota archaeon]